MTGWPDFFLAMEAVMAPDGDADLAGDEFSDVHVPDCERCGGRLKPDVVFYGDIVPRATVTKAYEWVANAKSLLVIGSSLMVFSSFRFVRRAAELGVPVYAINRGRTRGDELFVTKMNEDCVSALNGLNRLLSLHQ